MLKLMVLIRQAKRLVVITVSVVLLAACGQVTPVVSPVATQPISQTGVAIPSGTQNPTPTLVQELSTPELIGQAYIKGEITSEERLLYLAYAIFEYESLPSRFRSNVGWHGTFILAELQEAANSPSVFCNMSPYIRSEFQRLLKPDTICN